METKVIDDKQLREMLVSGYHKLSADKEMVNGLNVFPVPDGDTGTNMSLTLKTAVDMLEKEKSTNTGDLLRSFSKGSLMGARGNSGVILSQIFGGFARGAEQTKTLDVPALLKALESSVEVAYKAVMKPVEGTILTVIRQSAEWMKVEENVEELSMVDFFSLLVDKAKASLEGTPELLPVLKTSGVVDAGGQGLVSIFEGFLAALKGEKIDFVEEQKTEAKTFHQQATDIRYAYCTEFILRAKEKSNDQLRDKILSYGDSVVFVQDEDIIKIHVHTNHPGEALETALKYGMLLNVKIDNMKLQHDTIMGVHHDEDHDLVQEVPMEEKDYGIITIAAGKGFTEIFSDLGVDAVIEGGQTMNPSTEDILKEVDRLHAKHILILPNNSNIVLAAKQAQSMSEKDIHVIESKTVPQGISAMMGYSPQQSLEENLESMTESLDISTIQITYSVRNTKINDFVIKEKDILCIKDGEIVAVEKSPEKALRKVLDLFSEEYDLITVYLGEDADYSKTRKILESAEKKYEDVELELYKGDQPVYYYILSLE